MAGGKVRSLTPVKEKKSAGFYVKVVLKYIVLIFASLCAVVPLSDLMRDNGIQDNRGV